MSNFPELFLGVDQASMIKGLLRNFAEYACPQADHDNGGGDHLLSQLCQLHTGHLRSGSNRPLLAISSTALLPTCESLLHKIVQRLISKLPAALHA